MRLPSKPTYTPKKEREFTSTELEDQSIAERDTRERKRRHYAGDGNTFLYIYFESALEKMEFGKLIGDDSDFIKGESLKGLIEPKGFPKPTKVNRLYIKPVDATEAEDESDFWLSCWSRLWDCFLEHSEHHCVCLVFQTGEDAAKFLAIEGWRQFGDRFLDGSKILAKLR